MPHILRNAEYLMDAFEKRGAHSQPYNNQHAPDENIRIGKVWSGMDIDAEIFTMK